MERVKKFTSSYIQAGGKNSFSDYYIAKELIEENNGEICLECKPGEGTKVYFKLPVNKEKLEKTSKTVE